MNNHNPYDIFGGVFVPYVVLSSRRISLGAKILYALLAKSTDIRGESLLNPSLLAVEMGVDQEVVLSLADELSDAHLIKIRQDPSGTEFLRCHFPPNAWQKDNPPLNDKVKDASPKTTPRLLKLPGSTSKDNESIGHSGLPAPELQQGAGGMCSQKSTASRFPKKVCIEYAKARRQAEGKIDNPYALGTALWKSGDGDEEITLWLRSKEPGESAA